MMKRFGVVAISLILVSISAFGGNNESDSLGNEKDKICLVKEFIHEGAVYFHINVLNETENTFYSLIKFKEGQEDEFSSVDVCEGYANSIDSPIFYSFKDVKAPDMNMKYKLIAIRTDGSIAIAEWTYIADNNTVHLDYAKKRLDSKSLYFEQNQKEQIQASNN